MSEIALTSPCLDRALGALALATLACIAGACDPCAGVVAHIEALGPGETYVIPAQCTVTESVTVPAGASVEGGTFELERGESITLEPSPDDDRATSLASTTVRGGNDAEPAIVARGAGHVSISGVSVELERGIAIGISGASASVSGVTIVGNVDPLRAAELPVPADPAEIATYGVAAIDGATVTAAELDVRRLAAGALACSSATLRVTGASLIESRGIAAALFDCVAALDDVEITGTIATALRPGMGIAAGASEVTATRLHVHDAPGYALLARGGEITLVTPTIERLTQAGVWVEEGASLEVEGGTFTANRGTSIAAVGAARLAVRDTVIADTALAPIPTMSGTSIERMGDAIHVVQRAPFTSEVELAELSLTNNERVGVVLDGAMSPLPLSIRGTRIETRDDQLGALAQNIAALPATWDAEVTRVGSAVSLDPVAGTIVVSEGGLTGILMPPTIVF